MTHDEAIDRVLLNRLRELPSVNIHLALFGNVLALLFSFPDLSDY